MLKRIILFFILCNLPLVICANIFNMTNSFGQVQKKNLELQEVNSQIQGLQQNLQQEEDQRSELINQLRTIELSIGHTANKLARLDKNLNSQQQILIICVEGCWVL